MAVVSENTYEFDDRVPRVRPSRGAQFLSRFMDMELKPGSAGNAG
jgi:hypothetical protein